MRPSRISMFCVALLGLGLTGQPAAAAWDNVFQATCFFRNRQTTTHYYAAPVVAQSSPVVAVAPVVASSSPCDPCQQTQCTTRYIQRCYYEPVTTYQTQTYYEPVTTFRTSFYYEPVTSYRYSCFFDPCTCSYKQVAVPTTSYQLRSQMCPTQSWVQRCTQVPVTTYRQAFYWQPQTTCCTTTTGAPILAQPAAPVQTPVQAQSPAPPPVVTEQQTPAPPKVSEQTTPGTGVLPQQYDKYYGPPPAGGTNWKPGASDSYHQPSLGFPTPSGKQSLQPSAQPKITLDRIVSASGNVVHGQVVQGENRPQPSLKVLFVSVERRDLEQTATTDAGGRFQVSLAPGNWRVYVEQPGGRQVFHSQIEVSDRQNSFITLVSR